MVETGLRYSKYSRVEPYFICTIKLTGQKKTKLKSSYLNIKFGRLASLSLFGSQFFPTLLTRHFNYPPALLTG